MDPLVTWAFVVFRRIKLELSSYISVGSGISCAQSYRTLRDGSFEGGFPRHFVPWLLSAVPPGQDPFKEGCAARDPSLEMSKL
jgi:hypothetical protein